MTPVRIDQELMRIETMPIGGIVRAVHAIAVDGARPCIRQIAVPDLVRIFWKRNPFDFCRAIDIKDAKFNFRGVCGEEREIHADAVPGGAKWEGLTLADAASDRGAGQNEGRRNGRDLNIHERPGLAWPDW